MAKKNGWKKWLVNNAVSLIIAFAFLALVYGLYTGIINLGGTTNLNLGGGTTNLFQSSGNIPWLYNNVTNYYLYNVLLSFDKNPACTGDTITGTITSNIPNGICSIWFNPGTGWQFLANVRLNAAGKYSQSGQINTAGQATFIAICSDAQGNAKISNPIVLVVNNCSTPTGPQYYCCFAMGLYSCYENQCPPAGIQISGPYSTVPLCQANCSGNGGNGGTACSGVWNPSPMTCTEASCPTGQLCTYVPDTAYSTDRCECKTTGSVDCSTVASQFGASHWYSGTIQINSLADCNSYAVTNGCPGAWVSWYKYEQGCCIWECTT